MGFDPVAFALGKAGAPVRGDTLSYLMGKALAVPGWHFDDGTKLVFGQYDNTNGVIISGGTDLLTVRESNKFEMFNGNVNRYENAYNGSSKCGVRKGTGSGSTLYGVKAADVDHIYVALYTDTASYVAGVIGEKDGVVTVGGNLTATTFEALFGNCLDNWG